MNHGPAFQALWKRLRTEVRQLQDKGYYGDVVQAIRQVVTMKLTTF